jgi:hypothetical protein
MTARAYSLVCSNQGTAMAAYWRIRSAAASRPTTGTTGVSRYASHQPSCGPSW